MVLIVVVIIVVLVVVNQLVDRRNLSKFHGFTSFLGALPAPQTPIYP
jgi:hypothetical protein